MNVFTEEFENKQLFKDIDEILIGEAESSNDSDGSKEINEVQDLIHLINMFNAHYGRLPSDIRNKTEDCPGNIRDKLDLLHDIYRITHDDNLTIPQINQHANVDELKCIRVHLQSEIETRRKNTLQEQKIKSQTHLLKKINELRPQLTNGGQKIQEFAHFLNECNITEKDIFIDFIIAFFENVFTYTGPEICAIEFPPTAQFNGEINIETYFNQIFNCVGEYWKKLFKDTDPMLNAKDFLNQYSQKNNVVFDIEEEKLLELLAAIPLLQFH